MVLLFLCLIQVCNLECPVIEESEPMLFGDETLDNMIYCDIDTSACGCEQEFTWEEIREIKRRK